jgi:hypothetical protein
MNILQRLSLLWTRFSPLEERLLAAVRGVVPEGAQPVFDAQVADTARRLTLDQGEFLILAERPGDEYVMHRIEPPASVFYLASHDSAPEPINGQISDVFRET